MEKSFETKKQHYLPRLYLRQFETSVPKHVGCVSLTPYRWIQAANIGGQCQESYFYGEDGRIEKLLREEEDKIAPILDRVIREECFTNDDYLYLALLTTMTLARTRKAANMAKLLPLAIGNKIVKQGIDSGELPEPEGGWKNDMLDIKGISGMLLGLSYYCMMEMQTLKHRLLKAPSGSAFITSDHPVVTLNQFAANAAGPCSYVGFALAGFQLCFPLCPQLCLFFYDPLIYRAWDQGKQILEIPRNDVDVINGLQVLSAESNLYFNSSITEDYVKSLLASHAEKHCPIDGLYASSVDSRGEQFFHYRSENILPPKPWSFCKLQKPPRHRLGELRNPEWSAKLDSLFTDIRQHPFEYLAALG